MPNTDKNIAHGIEAIDDTERSTPEASGQDIETEEALMPAVSEVTMRINLLGKLIVPRTTH